MTPEEAQRAFDALRRLVGESPLAWVLPNVEDEIQRGKPGTRNLEKTGDRRAVDFDVTVPLGVRKRRSDEFTTVTPFTPTEKLHLLGTAMERVLREIPDLQAAAMRDLGKLGISDITFGNDDSEEEYTLTQLSGIRELSLSLSELLNKLES